MAVALKDSGVIYTSFKYGNYEGERNGRYFTDFTIKTFEEYLQRVPELQIEEYWITGDVRGIYTGKKRSGCLCRIIGNSMNLIDNFRKKIKT